MLKTHSTRSRRRGQALLLAVLVMILTALLGSTFLVIVAANLNQTAREDEKQAAINAAQVGLSSVNQQLVESKLGENWRPEQLTPPPAPENLSYSDYYSEVDKAQGWARQVAEAKNSDTEAGNASLDLPPVTGGDYNGDGGFTLPEDDWAKLEYHKSLDENNRVFVKFPDPRQPIPANAPRYMAEVTFLNEENKRVGEDDKVGMLRITVIGQADGERAWEQKVAYKGTAQRGGPISFARFDANADPVTGKPVESRIKEVSVTANVLNVEDASAFRPGHLVLISSAGQETRRAIVQSVDTNSSVLIIKAPITPVAAKGETVRLASPLIDAVETIDANGYASANEAAEAPVRVASAPTTASGETPIPVGAQFNGGLSLEGRSTIKVDSTRKDFVRVAGNIVNYDAANKTDAARLARVQDVSTSDGPVPILKTGESSRFNVQKLVFSGDKNSDPTQSQSAAAVEPATMSLDRYRELTRDADPGGAYGYGPGLYIDNAQDVEKVESGGKLQKLAPDQLHRLLQRKSFKMKGGGGNIAYNANMAATAFIAPGTDAFRLAWPRKVPVPIAGDSCDIGGRCDSYLFPRTTGSLEEKGVRGWVNPWEYLPRGVNVELDGEKITVHRDSRSDSALIDTGKSWRNINGQSFASPLGDRVYRMELTRNASSVTRKVGAQNASTEVTGSSTKEFNGVIFAEGNIRIRGSFAQSLTKDLVVVSGGNIYVEGSLRRADGEAGHIALIARGSVIYNPTQMLSRLDCIADRDIADPNINDKDFDANIQDETTTIKVGGTIAAGNTLPVVDASRFRVGDFVYLPAAEERPTLTSPNRFQVIGIEAGPKLRVQPNFPAINTTSTTSPAPTGGSDDDGDDDDGGTPVTTPADDLRVFLLSEPKVTTDTTTGEYFRVLKMRQDSLIRQVNFDGSNTNTMAYVAARMAGERRQAMFLERQTSTSPEAITVSADNNNNGIIEAGERRLKSQMSGTPDREKEINEDLMSSTLAEFAGDFRNHEDARYHPHWRVENNNITKLDSQKEQLRARFMALIGNRRGYYPQDGALPSPNYNDVRINNGQGYSIPLATSVNVTLIDPLLGRKMQAVIGARATNADLGKDSTDEITFNDADAEHANFLSETFYQTVPTANTNNGAVFAANTPPANTEHQARLRGVSLPLPTRGSANVSYLELRPNFNDLPALRVADLKLELENKTVARPGNWWRVGDAGTDTGTTDYNAFPVQIDAAIVANTGSWFVVPTPMNQGFDINGNTTIDANEQHTGSRFRRPNYKISVRGTIAQAFSATGFEDYDNEVDPDGQFVGAMAKWLDTSSYPLQLSATSGYSAKGMKWQTIEYQYAPLSQGASRFTPVARGLIYQG